MRGDYIYKWDYDKNLYGVNQRVVIESINNYYIRFVYVTSYMIIIYSAIPKRK